MSYPSLTLHPTTEEEKKIIAPLLGKLYVSPISSEDKVRGLYGEVSDAVEGQLLSDATGRNALYKIHVSLGKIVNGLDAATGDATIVGIGRRSTSRSVSASTAADKTIVEDRTVVEDRTIMEDRTALFDATIKEEDEEEGDGDSNEGTVVHHEEGDSLVDDLLTDDGEA